MADKKKLLSLAGDALSGGADVLQLRDKTARIHNLMDCAKRVKRLCGRRGVPLIINDSLEIALAAHADGIHVGGADIEIAIARKIMGPDKIIGASVSTVKDAGFAIKSGADYLGVGPAFRTPIKPEKPTVKIAEYKKIMRLGLPTVAVGGIHKGNIEQLTRHGVQAVAVLRALAQARNPLIATRRLKEMLCS